MVVKMGNCNLEFCDRCGGWVGAAGGQVRAGENGSPVIICDECLEGHTVAQDCSGLTNGVSRDSLARDNRSSGVLGPRAMVTMAR